MVHVHDITRAAVSLEDEMLDGVLPELDRLTVKTVGCYTRQPPLFLFYML